MLCRTEVVMCHIFPISRSPWNVWKCIQAHILFLLLVSNGDFQPESKEKSHKHIVSLTQKQNLCQEHLLLNRIRPIFIWSHGCKTMRECRHTVWCLTTSYRVVLFFWIADGMFMYKGERSAGLQCKIHTAALYNPANLSCFYPQWKKGKQTKVMVVFHLNWPPDVFIITGNWKECWTVYIIRT